MEKKDVLIFDHEEDTKQIIREALNKDIYRLFTASDELEATSLLKRRNPHFIIFNLHLLNSSGFELLKKIKAQFLDVPIIAIGKRSYDGLPETAKQLGVFACLSKPLVPEIVKDTLNDVMQTLENENQSSQEECYRTIVGESAKIKQVLSLVQRVAPSSSTVLINGESGTGKELVARAIHSFSPRAKKPFITVNCAALPEGLLESELFGVRQGAFTGATTNRDGKWQLAEGGTLVLDEISELPLHLQAKLLRVIQEKEVTPLGGTTPKKVNVRLIAITNQNLLDKVKEGKFRKDLFYRLNVIPIEVPSLNDRREDIPLLVQHFLDRYSVENRKGTLKMADDALSSLMAYSWPGNIRELENAIEKAVVLSEGKEIHIKSLFTLQPSQAKKEMKYVQVTAEVPHGTARNEIESSAEAFTEAWSRLGFCQVN